MNPNPQPTPPAPAAEAGPPVAGEPLVEFIRTNRQNAAYLLLGLSALFLAATVWLAVRSFRTTPATPDRTAVTNPLEPETPPPEIADPKRGDYTVGWIGTAVGFLITATAAAYLLVSLPRPTVEEQRTQARTLILVVGGLLGLFLIALGGLYFYRWSDSLGKWLDRGERREMQWVVIPLLMVAAGSGLVFAAVQPARAEERNNPALRRLVYGSNFGLTVLLLLVVLVVANVAIAMKVPNQLDTTETGFYSLSDSTRAFLAKLPEPANLYILLPDTGDREVNDIRQFALSAQEASDGRLTARFVSPVTNKQELQRLQEKYPRIDRNALGVLLTVGADETRSAYIPFEDLFETNPRTGRPQGFAGEGKVMRELRFLADNEQRPVVYFTQGHGELSLGGAAGVETAVGGSASQLKAFLERAYLDVRPLTFPPQNATVPGDAAVVVVAEPQSPLPAAAAGAVRKYMTEPRPGGGKGKLIVLAGAVPGPDGKVVKTGLEDLLAEFNVQLGDKFVYSDPLTVPQAPDYRVAIAVFAKAAEQNPIVQAVGKQVSALPFFLPREVTTTTARPEITATTLMLTLPGRETWLEDERIQNPEQVITDLLNNAAVRQRKQYTESPRRVAAVVAEAGGGGGHGGPTGAARAVVIGNAQVFTDEYASRRGRGGPPVTFDLMAVSIDWLRDRPPVATTVENKVYQEYQFPQPAAVDTTRLLYFPLGLGLLVVAGLGAGVWVMRRK